MTGQRAEGRGLRFGGSVGRVAAIALGMSLMTSAAFAQQTPTYDELYAKYLSDARSAPATNTHWMSDLASDPRARHVNDLLTIHVLESLSATGSADSNVGKKSSNDVEFPTPIGTAVGKLMPNTSETKFEGSGGTTRTTELTASMTARVTEVLPTGDFVIEGVREIDINGDRSLVVLTGVVRSTDIQPGNVVLSTSIGQLRIQSLSQGLIKDSLQPGFLARMLNKVF